MNVLVTVGTFQFDLLIKEVDEIAAHCSDLYRFRCQIGSGAFIPKECESFVFSEGFQAHIEWADVVITHAGAGTVYSLLEQKKDIIVIPNLSRVDDHQKEIAQFVESNNYGLSCTDLNDLNKVLHSSRDFFEFYKQPYRKVDFFKGDEIMNFFCD